MESHVLTTLAPDIAYGDLNFSGRPRIIATMLLFGRDGVAIVDPGPASSLPALRALLELGGASVADISALLLTHIHLDHAGATGSLLAENPKIQVFVHESGAKHLVDPSKLLASAGRLYGDAMERLWGEVLPVPAAAIESMEGGERIAAGNRMWEVAYTPGHASHHVSYFSPEAGIALVGDTAGVQVIRGGFVLPPTPPPDINIPLWLKSLEVIAGWRPATLFLTHFGPSDTPVPHLAELRDHLETFVGLAQETLRLEGDDAAREAAFIGRVRQQLRTRLGEDDLRAYELAGRFDLNWRGLARYVTKHLR
jgi:glyoxylase-like metal-dependent hydrolase (beta-lactamase superfamily II)